MLKYQSIAADIQHSIEDGSLKPNDKLPTVVELCQIYDVSKITVKRAFDVLVEKGLISSKRGSGTYVKSAQTVTSPRGASAGFTAEVGSLGFTRSDRARGFTAENEDEGEVSSVVYEFSVINPPERVTQYLGIQPDDFTYRHCRVRCLNDVPIVIEYTYMPIDLIPGLKKASCTARSTAISKTRWVIRSRASTASSARWPPPQRRRNAWTPGRASRCSR